MHKVDDILRFALKVTAQLRVLGSDAHRTGIQIADAHHNAAQSDQRRSGKAELFGTQQGGDDHVASGHQLTVGFQSHTVAQVVEQQRLMGLHQSQFPGQSGVVDTGAGRSTCAAVVAGDQHYIGTGFNDACGNGSDANLRNQLDADFGTGIGVFQIVYQFG